MEPMPTVTCGIASLRGGDLARELGDLADDEVRRELVHRSVRVSGSAARAFNRPNSPVST